MERSGSSAKADWREKNLKTGNYTEFRDISDGLHLRPRRKAAGVNVANSI